MNSDGVLVDIPDDDEFDKCTGTPQIAAEHASAIAFSGISFPDSMNTRLSKTKDAASQDLEKSKAKPTPAQVRFEEDIVQVFIREIFVRGQEKTLMLEVEKSDTVDDVKSKILKEMSIPKDMQKLRHACLSLQDDEILSH
jgi:hypothetical protein